MTNEEATKYFEENLSPLIRYGFNESLHLLVDWLGEREGNVVPITDVMEKCIELSNEAQEVRWKELREEFVHLKQQEKAPL